MLTVERYNVRIPALQLHTSKTRRGSCSAADTQRDDEPDYEAYEAAAFFAARAASRRPVPHVSRFFFLRSFHALRERVFLVAASMRISRYRGSSLTMSSTLS